MARYRSRRLCLICKLSHRAKVDRTYGHLLRLRQFKGLKVDDRRGRLVETLHVNLEDVEDKTWSMPDLNLDRRTADAKTMCYDFRCCELNLDEGTFCTLLSDCRVRAAQGGSSWMPAAGSPRCLPELLAAEVFRHHTRGVEFDPARSGAEWWTQVRESGSVKSTIKFHWDADEFGLDQHDVGLHPHLSTVTYLTNEGTPTLVLNCHGLEKTASNSPCGPIQQGLLSYPSRGKHIVFDGQLLHGNVPDDSQLGQRVTFLVNVWLNHRPSKSLRLPTELLPYFGSPKASVALTPLIRPNELIKDPAARVLHTKVQRHIYRYVLHVPLPLSCGTSIIQWTHDASLQEV